MSRLAILIAAAITLPVAGNKPADVVAPSNAAPVVTAAWAPKLRLPHMPRFKRTHGAEVQVGQMNRRLRAMVVQQEAWFAENGRYGRDAVRLNAKAMRRPDQDDRVQVDILYADRKGWTAMASHPDAPGKSCVVYVGVRDKLPIVLRTRADGNDATMEGIPACDSK